MEFQLFLDRMLMNRWSSRTRNPVLSKPLTNLLITRLKNKQTNKQTNKGSALLLKFLGLKRIVFVLSSPKWIDSLLSKNQSHNELKSWLSFSLINLIFLCRKEIHVSSAYNLMSQYLTDCGRSLIYMRKSKGPKIDPCRTPHTSSGGSE